jgi:hypothetical protein
MAATIFWLCRDYQLLFTVLLGNSEAAIFLGLSEALTPLVNDFNISKL